MTSTFTCAGRSPGWRTTRLAAGHRADASASTGLLVDPRLRDVRDAVQELVRRNRLELRPPVSSAIQGKLDLAITNFERAVRHSDDGDLATIFLYQALVNTADALVDSLGCTALDFEGHKVALDVAARVLSALQSPAAGRLFAATSEQLRRKRHQALYFRSGVVSTANVRSRLGECRRLLPPLWRAAAALADLTLPHSELVVA